MLPFSFIGAWSYTNPATPVAVNIPMTAKPDWVFVKDTTNWGAQSTAANPIYSEWFSLPWRWFFSGSWATKFYRTGVTTYASQGTSGGFTFIDQTNPPTFTKVAVTAVNGTTFVVATGTTTGINVGDTVRLINIVGGQQISGPNLYQVTAVSAGVSITLGYAASAASAGLLLLTQRLDFTKRFIQDSSCPTHCPLLT